MLDFKLWLESILGNFEYVVPKNKKEQLCDFYMLSLLDKSSGFPSHTQDSILDAVKDAKIKLIPFLKQSLLDDVFFCICAELRHVLDVQTKTSVDYLIDVTFSEKTAPKYKNIFDKYIKYLDLYKTSHDAVDVYSPPKKAKDYKNNNTQRLISYYAALKAGNFANVVRMAKFLFSKTAWEDNYGGQNWSDVCDGWMRLYNAKSEGDLMVAIDHVYDLEHNTGVVFNKLISWGDEASNYHGYQYDWIKDILDLKRNATSPYELFDCISLSMKRLAGFALKDKYNTTHQPWEANIKPITDEEMKPYMKEILLRYPQDANNQWNGMYKRPSDLWLRNFINRLNKEGVVIKISNQKTIYVKNNMLYSYSHLPSYLKNDYFLNTKETELALKQIEEILKAA